MGHDVHGLNVMSRTGVVEELLEIGPGVNLLRHELKGSEVAEELPYESDLASL
jgi:hypothetical protein